MCPVNDSEKTLNENPGKSHHFSEHTISDSVVNDEKTIVEPNQQSLRNFSQLSSGGFFGDYQIIEKLPASGAEADIFKMHRDGKDYILKLYRSGLEPSEKILQQAWRMSENFSAHIVRIFEYGFQAELKQWYEIQEFARFGTLEQYLKRKTDSDVYEVMHDVFSQLVSALNIIHESSIVHRDLKPSNILVRAEFPELNLVFTDFGISTALDQVSRKITAVKGTPLYWSPEAFTGIVGKEADYWALGMILLEFLIGQHPFRGAEISLIMYTLSTQGVEVPDTIRDDYKQLLKGLLTRNVKKRWGFSEVTQWFEGKRDIPIFYDYSSGSGYSHVYTFEGEHYNSVPALLQAFCSSPGNFETGCSHIEKGFLSRWLEQNSDFDAAHQLTEIMKKYSEPMVLFSAVCGYFRMKDFTVFGKVISVNNLYLFLAHLQTEKADETEEKICMLMHSPVLYQCCTAFLESGGMVSDDVLKILKLLHRLDVFQFKEFCTFAFRLFEFWHHPDWYLYNDDDTGEKKLKFLSEVFYEKLFLKEELTRMKDSYFIPYDLMESLYTEPVSVKSLEQLHMMIAHNWLIARDIADTHYIPAHDLRILEHGEFQDYFSVVQQYEGFPGGLVKRNREMDSALRKKIEDAESFNEYEETARLIYKNVDANLLQSIDGIIADIQEVLPENSYSVEVIEYLRELKKCRISWSEKNRQCLQEFNQILHIRMNPLKYAAIGFFAAGISAFIATALLFMIMGMFAGRIIPENAYILINTPVIDYIKWGYWIIVFLLAAVVTYDEERAGYFAGAAVLLVSFALSLIIEKIAVWCWKILCIVYAGAMHYSWQICFIGAFFAGIITAYRMYERPAREKLRRYKAVQIR